MSRREMEVNKSAQILGGWSRVRLMKDRTTWLNQVPWDWLAETTKDIFCHYIDNVLALDP
jgi:hypothetical protein